MKGFAKKSLNGLGSSLVNFAELEHLVLLISVQVDKVSDL